MGKASSAKKIARAQRAGATTGPSERREIGFPVLVTVLIVAGVLLVGWARTSRDAQASPTLQDHWHSAYSVWDCVSGDYLSPFLSEADPFGIHSHTDSLIHIHPFTASVTGKLAKLGIFFDAMGVEVTSESVELPGDQSMEAGVDCDGEPAIIQVVRWTDVLTETTPTEVITDDFYNMRFLAEGEGFTIARAPLGADIPLPNSLDALSGAIGQPRDEGVELPNDTEVVQPQDFGLDGPVPNDDSTDSSDAGTGEDSDTTAEPTASADG
jgi:hypothetical protein